MRLCRTSAREGRFVLKKALAELLSCSGIHALLERGFYARKACVLMYHRILSAPERNPWFVQPGMFVSAASFERHIAYLRNNFTMVFLDDLAEMAANREPIGRHCAITFDDGWRDNYTEAFPLLEKYRIPATIFLSTGYVNTDRMFWPEELCHYLEQWMTNTSASQRTPALVRFRNAVARVSAYPREFFFTYCIETLKGFTPGEREEVLESLRGANHAAAAAIPRQMLNWDEVRQMHDSGLVRFGAHTVNHEMLDQLPLSQAFVEIEQSRRDIEERLDVNVTTFSYPNGNYNERISSILTDSGFTAALTTCRGYLNLETPLLQIPRISIHEDIAGTIPLFRSRMLLPVF